MTWATKIKDLGTSSMVPHVSTAASLVGRAPATSTMTLSPFELFGAAARCSHLHLVNPAIITPESEMLAKLIEPHVDDVSRDFAILSSADSFKDFVKSYFVGSVAAGLSYMAMVNDGYVWSDHFEHVGGGHPSHGQKPDFVFAAPGAGLALVEAKGSRSGSLGGFDTTVSDGYHDQVEPHLGHVVGTGLATHGYCVGSWLKSTTRAELRIHHTAVPALPGNQIASGASNMEAVQRHNYATALSLVHGPRLGNALRAGESRYSVIPFLRFSWLGQSWVTGFGLDFRDKDYPDSWWWRKLHLRDPGQLTRSERVFALEETLAGIVLAQFLAGQGLERFDPSELKPIGQDVRDAARREGEGSQGAVFPDGLAVVDLRGLQIPFRPVYWEAGRPGFHPG